MWFSLSGLCYKAFNLARRAQSMPKDRRYLFSNGNKYIIRIALGKFFAPGA